MAEKGCGAGAPIASKFLLTLHDRGEPVSHDEAEVAAWRRTVVESPTPRQKIETAEHYLTKGGPRDLVDAYKWAELALLSADDGTDEAKDVARLCKHLAPMMSTGQVTEATRREKAWQALHEDECTVLLEDAQAIPPQR